MKIKLLPLLFLSFGLNLLNNSALFSQVNQSKPEDTTKVVISTTYGDIKIKLYNKTPLHRDNFIKLINQKFYDSLLFHRVINEFMIQGGDPDSKNAKPGVMLGNGDVGYTIPAEFVPEYYHKRGALAAARMGDDVNPKKESSGCQFYIVHGKVFSASDLEMMKQRRDMGEKQKVFNEFISKEENKSLKDKFIRYQTQGKTDSIQLLSNKIGPVIDSIFNATPHFAYTQEQINYYSTIGGAPHLDNNYTVFGEVYEGLDVVDKIAAQAVDGNSRPMSDIMMNIKIIQPEGKNKKGKSKKSKEKKSKK